MGEVLEYNVNVRFLSNDNVIEQESRSLMDLLNEKIV